MQVNKRNILFRYWRWIMGKPTVEEYEKALQDRNDFRSWLSMECKRRDEFLDELLNSRENIKMYRESLDKANEIIQKYEIYQEIESKGV